MRGKRFMALSGLFGLCGLCLSASVMAQGPLPLDDDELGQVSGGDGISIAMHYALNDPSIPGVTQNRRSWGFKDENGQSTYLVYQNMHGTIDMFALKLDVEKTPDSADYLAITLPPHLKFTNFGFDSLSAQTDPLGPVTDSIGGFNVNGTLSMQGQLRLWAH